MINLSLHLCDDDEYAKYSVTAKRDTDGDIFVEHLQQDASGKQEIVNVWYPQSIAESLRDQLTALLEPK